MNDDETLELLARIAILAGKLPAQRIHRIWAGVGEGSCCNLCGDRVDRGQPGYEFDLPDSPGSCALHFRCFAAWNSARERLETRAVTNKDRKPVAAESSAQMS